MNMSTAKKCTSRDAATATLRKLGVIKADYDSFIVKRDGVYYVDVNGAEKHVDKPGFADQLTVAGAVTPKQAKADKAANQGVTKPRVAKTVVGDKLETCSDVARALIRAGKTNQGVWDVISVQFNLDTKKRGYPSWYRNQMKKSGEAV